MLLQRKRTVTGYIQAKIGGSNLTGHNAGIDCWKVGRKQIKSTFSKLFFFLTEFESLSKARTKVWRELLFSSKDLFKRFWELFKYNCLLSLRRAYNVKSFIIDFKLFQFINFYSRITIFRPKGGIKKCFYIIARKVCILLMFFITLLSELQWYVFLQI